MIKEMMKKYLFIFVFLLNVISLFSNPKKAKKENETSVTLKNAKLQKVICKQLNKKDLSEQDLLGITEIFLNAKFGNVSDLDGIERLENLEKLIIYPGKLKSIASIRELKN